jgi:sterol desaturase/sphingolipid hydroxylase (fatty acid hydroxylase superfamily)
MKMWLNLFRRTPREYYADFFITPPITFGLLIASLSHATTWWPVELAAGLLIWTLYEYVVHRISHKVKFFRDIHALHHRNQRDYIAIHPAVTLALYAVFWMLFGFGTSALMVGFSIGYIIYSIEHTAFHYATIDPGHFLYGLKMRHVLHHRMDVNFGVSTSLWDRVFKTESAIRLVSAKRLP